MKYRDLPINPAPGVALRCRACGNSYSAHRSDYFTRLEERIGRCDACPVRPPLILARETREIIALSPEEAGA